MLSYYINGKPGDPGVFPDKFHLILAKYADAVYPKLKFYFRKDVAAEIFGKDDCDNFKQANDIILLGIFLSAVYAEKIDQEHFGACTTNVTEELRTKYKFDCLRKYFKCYNIDTKPLEELFGLGENPERGIGHMEIEGDGSCGLPFKIT